MRCAADFARPVTQVTPRKIAIIDGGSLWKIKVRRKVHPSVSLSQAADLTNVHACLNATVQKDITWRHNPWGEALLTHLDVMANIIHGDYFFGAAMTNKSSQEKINRIIYFSLSSDSLESEDSTYIFWIKFKNKV